MAGARIVLTTADGEAVSAYHAPPGDARRGGLVILHAIWGVTPHIRALSDELAEQGYEVIAPSLLDPAAAPFPTLDTEPAILDQRMALGEASGWGLATLDRVQAAVDALAGPVFVMGFCFGGTTAWLAAGRCRGIAAVSAFYGGDIPLHGLALMRMTRSSFELGVSAWSGASVAALGPITLTRIGPSLAEPPQPCSIRPRIRRGSSARIGRP